MYVMKTPKLMKNENTIFFYLNHITSKTLNE